MKYHAFGITKTVDSILKIFLKTPSLYGTWLKLSPYQINKLKFSLRKSIQLELLNAEFKLALAKDILKDGEIAVESEVFKYLKRVVYKGNTRRLLSDLQSILESSK